MAVEDNSNLKPELVICLIAAASIAIVVTIYHCCITTCNLLSLLRHPFWPRLDQIQQSSGQKSLTDLIPSHKYQKGSGLFANQDEMCSICLSEFEEGEELRTLPKCMHSFHASCIDMWFYSHFNCPMCRTNAAPSPQTMSLVQAM